MLTTWSTPSASLDVTTNVSVENEHLLLKFVDNGKIYNFYVIIIGLKTITLKAQLLLINFNIFFRKQILRHESGT